MKIALFGGRFDPPHIGHFLIAQQILDFRSDIDKVILVPAFKHQWKPIVASAKDRLAMLKKFISPKIEVSDIEIKRGGISYSIDTIRAIKEKTQDDLFWIVGADILSEFNKWNKADDLLKEAKFLIFPRDLCNLPDKIPAGFEIISSSKILTTNISSTVIRERIKTGKSIKGLVFKEVEEYIKRHNLYV
jgi:nicotinate-nucleotide adenylyltransferase